MSRSIRLAAILAILLLYLGFPNARPDLTWLNADDAEIYLALSHGLATGAGYTRGWAEGTYIPHTAFPPGLPVLLLPALAAIGMPINWLVLKLYMAGIGLAGLGVIWAYVRRLTQDRMTADFAMILVGLSPFYWWFSHMVMSEMPSVVFGFAILWLIDVVWAGRSPGLARAAAVGVAAGAGMMIRGTMVGLLLVPLAYAFGPRRSALRPGQLIVSAGAYGLGFMVFPVLWFARNRTFDRTGLGMDGVNQIRMLLVRNPVDPVSPIRGLAEIMSDTFQNVIYRIVYRVPEQMIPGVWVTDVLDRPGMVYAAVLLSVIVVLLCLRRLRTVLPILLLILPQVAIQLLYAWGGSARFWVPITTPMTVMLAISLAPLVARLAAPARTAVAGAVTAIWALGLLAFILRHERTPMSLDFSDLVRLYEAARDRPDRPTPLLTEHALLYALIAGDAGPGPTGTLRYRGVTVREGGGAHTYGIHAPPGAVEVARSGAWRLLTLPTPMTRDELVAPATR